MNTLKNLSGRTAHRLTKKLAAKAERFKFPPSHAIVRMPEREVRRLSKQGKPTERVKLARVKPGQKTILRPSTARRLEYVMDRGLCEMFGENLVTAVNRYRKRHLDGTVTTERIDDKSPTCGV